MTEQHEMVLEETNSTGEENWYCPTCGRRMIITWDPWKKVVIEQGDLYAAHGGGKGGLQIRSMRALPIDESFGENAPEIEDPRLATWVMWLDESGFENLWKRNDQ